jgi:hypothetical protein
VARAAAAISSTTHASPAETSTSAASASAQDSPGAASQHRIRPVMPARRSSSASSSTAVPSQVAPPAWAARAAGTMPWPYPSAFTTVITAAGPAYSRRRATLARIASRSIRASLRRMRFMCTSV